MEAATASTFSRRAMPPARSAPTHPTFIRWLWIWITVAALVVIVVIGFLLGIVSALKSIDGGLLEANASVSGIGAEANPLPGYIQQINTNLHRIDGALKPISGEANQIVGALSSISGGLGQVQGSLVNTTGSLVNTSGSLVNTSGSLVNTSGSLVNTSGSLRNTSGSLVDTSNSLVDTSGTLGTISSSLVGISGTLNGVSGSLVDVSNRLVTIAGSLNNTSSKLVAVRGKTQAINTTLTRAETVNTLGTQAIWRRVRFANGGPFIRPGGNDFDNSLRGPGGNPNGLTPVRLDADMILFGLGPVNLHLNSICRAPVLNTATLPTLVRPGPCP